METLTALLLLLFVWFGFLNHCGVFLLFFYFYFFKLGFPLHSKAANWKAVCKGITRFSLFFFFALTAKYKTNRLQCIGNSSFFLYRSEAPFQQTSVNKCFVQTGNLMLIPQMEESTCKHLSQMGNTTHSYPSLTHAALRSVPLWTHDVCRAVQRPELWSPSSLMPQMKAGAEMVSVLLKEKLVGLLGYCQHACCLLLFFLVAPLDCPSGC